jgi:hypothetical protein
MLCAAVALRPAGHRRRRHGEVVRCIGRHPKNKERSHLAEIRERTHGIDPDHGFDDRARSRGQPRTSLPSPTRLPLPPGVPLQSLPTLARAKKRGNDERRALRHGNHWIRVINCGDRAPLAGQRRACTPAVMQLEREHRTFGRQLPFDLFGEPMLPARLSAPRTRSLPTLCNWAPRRQSAH